MNPVAGLSSKASRLGAAEIGDSSAADAVASVGNPALRARARTDGAERLGRYDLALEIAHHRLASEVVHLVAEVGHQTLIPGKACHANARLAHHHVYQQSDRCWPDAYVSLPTANLPGARRVSGATSNVLPALRSRLVALRSSTDDRACARTPATPALFPRAIGRPFADATSRRLAATRN